MSTMTDPKIEERIQKYRPVKEDEPASGGTLWHLNKHGLLQVALGSQQKKGGGPITKLTAWEVMAEAQRRGVTF